MWSTRRRILYIVGTLLALVCIFTFLFRNTLFPTPLCNDGKKNGFETGIDCGGTCIRKCAGETIPIQVVWAKSFNTGSSTYDVALFLKNKNLDTAPYDLEYTLTLYDIGGNQLGTVNAKTFAPIGGEFPIILENVRTSSPLAKVTAVLKETTSFKVPLTTANPFSVKTTFDTTSRNRVYAYLTNGSSQSFLRFPVRIVLYDAEGNAIGVSETYIESSSPKETSKVVFTWNTPFKDAPALMRVYPVIDPFPGRK